MSKVTVRRVVERLSVSGYEVRVGTVYGWLRGRSVPKPQAALALTRMSRGKIRLEDVYGHATEIKRNAAKTSIPSSSSNNDDGRSAA